MAIQLSLSQCSTSSCTGPYQNGSQLPLGQRKRRTECHGCLTPGCKRRHAARAALEPLSVVPPRVVEGKASREASRRCATRPRVRHLTSRPCTEALRPRHKASRPCERVLPAPRWPTHRALPPLATGSRTVRHRHEVEPLGREVARVARRERQAVMHRDSRLQGVRQLPRVSATETGGEVRNHRASRRSTGEHPEVSTP